MKFLTQFPVEQLSGHDGNVGGLVAMQSNGINIFRKHVIPNNPNTEIQQIARNFFTLAAQNFKTLSNSERGTWTTYAQIHPITVLGKSVTLQDMATYVRSDFLSYMNDTAHLTTAPTALPGFTASLIESVTWTSATEDLEFDLTHNGVAGEGFWKVEVTPALASAQRNARPTDFRLVLGPVTGSMPDVEASVTSVTITDALLTWSSGDWMEIKVTPISEDYAIGTPFTSRQQITVV